MVNFSPLGKDSGGFATPAGLGLSFAGTGVAAHRIPVPQKNVKEMTIRMRMDLLNFSSIVPPITKSYDKIYLYISSKFNANLILKDFDRG